MTKNIKEEYFEWMYDSVCAGRFAKENNYRKLLSYLNSIDYTWLIPKDINRAEDGEEGLRWKFAYETHTNIGNELDGPCSVLEMIIALAYRCEEIMDDAAVGDRTGQWFWKMINNLGLSGMSDRRFDMTYTEDVVERFLNRDFEPDGHGSLFVIKNCDYNLRDVEIWTTMLWYLDNIV